MVCVRKKVLMYEKKEKSILTSITIPNRFEAFHLNCHLTISTQYSRRANFNFLNAATYIRSLIINILILFLFHLIFLIELYSKAYLYNTREESEHEINVPSENNFPIFNIIEIEI